MALHTICRWSNVSVYYSVTRTAVVSKYGSLAVLCSHQYETDGGRGKTERNRIQKISFKKKGEVSELKQIAARIHCKLSAYWSAKSVGREAINNGPL